MNENELEGRNKRMITGADGQVSETRKRFVYKKIALLITAPKINCAHANFTLDKNILRVAGVAVFADDDKRIFKLTQRLEINGNEKLAQEVDARLLHAYNSVPVNEGRFFDVDEPAGNGVIKITGFDRSEVAEFGAAGGAYTVYYMFKCELA